MKKLSKMMQSVWQPSTTRSYEIIEKVPKIPNWNIKHWFEAKRDENSSVLNAFGPNPSMHAYNLHGDDFKWIFETLFRQIDMLEETTLDRPRSYQIN